VGVPAEAAAFGWLSGKRPIVVGLTAGASTPDVIVGAVIERLASFTAAPGEPLEPLAAEP
jgi:4-hydroxy-3-methylbut-2-enyl diphosphate reductase IspH